METLTQILSSAIESEKLNKIIFSGKRKKSIEYSKVTVRPITLKGEYMYQAEYHFDKKVTHKNIPYYETVDFALDAINTDFKQINILTEEEDIQILASKPDKPKVIRRKNDKPRTRGDLSHDRKKHYLIKDNEPCDFLIHLGVMSPEGKVVKKHYSKFRQINRFLEIADACFDELPKNGTVRIVDFGCGKSYLTFALYHYLKIIRGRNVKITGLDLKEDVIDFCNKTAKELGYDGLDFITGDIADYDTDKADMVVTLHACDTATDFALINAVRWDKRVILSVPCCQHELFSQIKNSINEPMLKHGIIKDKFTELLTDSLRGLRLESCGYRVNMMEFTSLEHTSKNIMIKAVRAENPNTDSMQRALKEYEEIKSFYSVHPTIDMLEPAFLHRR